MAKTKTANISSGALKACLALAIIFILEELLLPVNMANVHAYHMSTLGYRLVTILVNLPVIVVWFVAFWGYPKLSSYSKVLGSAPEAGAYRKLAMGIAWLTWVLPISAIINRALSGISDSHHKLNTPMTIISNYFNLILPLIAFIIIFVAAKTLLKSQKVKWEKSRSRAVMFTFLLGGALYCYLILRTADLSNFSNTNNVYLLPVWLVVLSIVIPSLYGWFMGLLASYELSLFSINMPGILYKRALLFLYSGLAAIILSFIASQYLSAVWPLKTHLVFNYRLAIIILFRVIGGLGFVVLAIGANKLKQIEEV